MITQEPIITSLLDTDLYKFSMGQVALHRFPTANVRFDFKCRDKGIDLCPYIDEIKDELLHFCSLRFTEDELDYLSNIRWFKPDYIEFLRGYRPNFEHLNVEIVNGELAIQVQGTWAQTIYWEVPLLSIVNEVYFRNTDTEIALMAGRARLLAKTLDLKDTLRDNPQIRDHFQFTEFGTRRRFSRVWQSEVIATLRQHLSPVTFIGTSNTFMSKKYGIKPFGTMAHEYQQVCQAYATIPTFISYALQEWANEYRGDLGIALTDVVGTDAFLKAFDLYYCKLFDGVRHDSGDPVAWGYKIFNHYRRYNIDPSTKTLVFSDGLDFPKAWELTKRFSNPNDPEIYMKVMHGIGTNLTNDMGVKALNIVMKVTECNGQPVAKISDSPGKGMCRDENYLNYLESVFGLRQIRGQERIAAMIASDPEGYASYMASR